MTQWDFQNKGTLTSPARLSFVLEVPLRHLRPSVIYSVPCDRILQRAYYDSFAGKPFLSSLFGQNYDDVDDDNTICHFISPIMACLNFGNFGAALNACASLEDCFVRNKTN